MIKIAAAIKIYDITDGVIEKKDVGGDPTGLLPNLDVAGNNISSGVKPTVNNPKTTENVFLVGSSVLDSGYVYSNRGAGYYIGKYLSSTTQESAPDNGYDLPSDTVIYFKVGSDGLLPSKITIVFDEKRVEYATKLVTSYKTSTLSPAITNTIYNNSSVLTFDVPNRSKNFSLTIKSWSAPNRPVVITGIYANLYYTIGKDKLINCEFELNEKSDETMPCWGVISNRGDIEFRDYDYEFLSYIENGDLRQRKGVEFYINNTYTDKTKSIASFDIDNIQYDDDSNVVSIELVDRLVEWQDVEVSWLLETDKTMLYVYNTLVSLTSANTSGFAFEELDTDTSNYLSNISLKFFYLKKDSLWAQWNKFCEATGLYLYINKDNKIVLGGEFDYSFTSYDTGL